MVLFLANVINDSDDNTLQMMTWPERERDRWRRFLSTKNYPVDIMAFAELRWLLDVPDPVMPTKEEMERKYKRQARYEREKERRYLWWLQMDYRCWLFTSAPAGVMLVVPIERGTNLFVLVANLLPSNIIILWKLLHITINRNLKY